MHLAILTHGIAPLAVGGMERHSAGLAKYLCQLGDQVDVYIPRLSEGQRQVLKAQHYPFQCIECEFPWRPTWLWSNYAYSQQVWQHLQKQNYSAILCQGFNGWAVLRSLPTSSSPLTFYHPHGLEMFSTQGIWQTLKHWPLRWAARQQAKHAAYTISLGGQLTQQVHTHLGVPATRLVELPNALDPDWLPQASLDNQHQPGQFLFVGRLEANKGVEVLCRAFLSLHAAPAAPQVRLKVVGDGSLAKRLRCQFQHPQIEFLGALADASLQQLYAQSEALLFASFYEGMPTVILEAMAAGLLVIATDIGAVATMVSQEHGFLVPAGDVAAMSHAMSQLLKLSQAQKTAMRQLAKQRLQTQFLWPHQAKKTHAVISDCIVSRR